MCSPYLRLKTHVNHSIGLIQYYVIALIEDSISIFHSTTSGFRPTKFNAVKQHTLILPSVHVNRTDQTLSRGIGNSNII